LNLHPEASIRCGKERMANTKNIPNSIIAYLIRTYLITLLGCKEGYCQEPRRESLVYQPSMATSAVVQMVALAKHL